MDSNRISQHVNAYQSRLNTSTTTLGAGETFTGRKDDNT